MSDPILDPLRRPTEHHPLCHVGQVRTDVTGDTFTAACDCTMRSTGPEWVDCEDAIAEIEALRAVVRYLAADVPHDLAHAVAMDLDDECAAAVRRALEAET